MVAWMSICVFTCTTTTTTSTAITTTPATTHAAPKTPATAAHLVPSCPPIAPSWTYIASRWGNIALSSCSLLDPYHLNMGPWPAVARKRLNFLYSIALLRCFYCIFTILLQCLYCTFTLYWVSLCDCVCVCLFLFYILSSIMLCNTVSGELYCRDFALHS